MVGRLLTIKNNRALVLQSQAKSIEFQCMLREDLKLTIGDWGRGCLSIFTSQSNFAVTLRHQGKVEEVEEIPCEVFAKAVKFSG